MVSPSRLTPRTRVPAIRRPKAGAGHEGPESGRTGAALLPQAVQPITRRYELLWREPDGSIGQGSRVAPAMAVIEEAFAAFGRGTLIGTPDGPVAIEDLLPGMRVDTAESGPRIVQWIGSMTLLPGRAGGRDGEKLLRLSAEAFGPDRPAPDLILGPRARLLYRHAGCRAILGSPHAFAPARALADGVSVVEVTPISPVPVYHLALDEQHAVLANGLEVESYHPGLTAEAMMSAEMLRSFVALFPHVTSLDGFGPMPVARLTAFEVQSLRAA